jgi:hypothetical protein
MENEHDSLVRQYLEKHFDAVGVVLEKDQAVVCCHLGSMLFRFPFYVGPYYAANPHDVENAIWEYIVDYML